MNKYKESKSWVLTFVCKLFGYNIHKRRERLKLAVRLTDICNLLSTVLFFGGIIYPRPYSLVLFLAFIIPLVSLILFKLFNGFIRIDKLFKVNSFYPDITFSFISPTGILMLRMVRDWEIYSYSALWWKVGLITVVILLILFVKQKGLNLKKGQDFYSVFWVLVLSCLYSFGAVIYINCMFDNSEYDHFTAKIINKHISEGEESEYYYLTLSAWGEQKESEDVEVSSSFYDMHEINETVDIYLRRGVLGIPWFDVREKNLNKRFQRAP